jgi:hypothetical protein
MECPVRALLAILCLMALPCSGAGAAERPLAELLAELAKDGVQIVWSDELVADRTLAVSSPASPEAVAAALADAPLELVLDGDLWLLRPAPDPTPVTETSEAIDDLIVTGSRHVLLQAEPGAPGRLLDERELTSLPALGGDMLRIVNRLPGFASIGISARPRVRGGLPEEMLFRIDGVELLDPFHLSDFQGLFSAVDDRAIDTMTLYTGGFPARYGNRMSGVLDMATPEVREGRTELGVSNISLFANTRGVSESGRTRWLLSGRRGDLERLSRSLGPRTGSPRFHDLFAHASHDRGELRFDAGTLRAVDDVRLVDDEEAARSRVDSSYLWLGASREGRAGDAESLRLSLVRSDRERTKRNDDLQPDADTFGFLDATIALRRATLSLDVLREIGGVRVEAGGLAGWEDTELASRAFVERGDLARLLSGAEIFDVDVGRSASGPYGGAYLSLEIPFGERLALQPGLRYDVQDFGAPEGRRDQWAPRLGLRWRPMKAVRVGASLGRYYQAEAIEAMQVADGVVALQRPQRADHAVITVDWQASPALALRFDAWEKRYGALRRRYENLYNHFVLLPELEPDRVAFRPDRARARGVEGELRWRPAPGVTSWLRYGYMDANDHVAGRSAPRRWSQQHTLQGALLLERGAFSVSTALTWHSGWRTSAPPATLAAGETLAIGDVLNNQRLRDFVSLDVGARWRRPLGRTTLELSADVSNALDRPNLAGIDHDVVAVPEGLRFVPEAERALPLIYTFGASIHF